MIDQAKSQFLLEFGERVKSLRIQKGMTLEELAKKIGYTTDNARSSVQKIESGKSDPPISRIRALAVALEVPVEILTGEQEMPVKPSGADFDEWEKKFNPNDELAAEAAMWDFIGKRYGGDTAEMMNQILELKPKEQEKISKLLTGYSNLDDEDRIILFARAYQILEDMLADDKYSAKGGLKHA